MEQLQKLSKDLRVASKTLSDREARFLVDSYYTWQENRIRAAAQARSMDKPLKLKSGEILPPEPHATITYAEEQALTLENQIKIVLDLYSMTRPEGQWARDQYGIGPVIAAGLLAHIDITKAPTAGHIWNFAGLNPGVVWEKGKKRPWNATLKTLCWKIGQSFMMFHNKEDCFYGQIYKKRKELEIAKNEAGEYAQRAADMLAKRNYTKDTETKKILESGKISPGQIDASARRIATKLFLAHYHQVSFESYYKTPAPKPYAMAILEHGHYILPPGWNPL